MEELGKEQREVLLFIHQSQREESLGHRHSMLSAFSLSMTGLMAILAGAIAIGHISPGTKWGVALAIVVVVLSIFDHAIDRRATVPLRSGCVSAGRIRLTPVFQAPSFNTHTTDPE